MAAYRALFQCAGLKPAERILIHGASGGVGTVAVQLARACGAFVIGTAGSPASMELVRSIGAHIVLDHTQPGYLDTLAALTDGVEIHGLFVKGTSASVILESLFFKTNRGGVLIISIYDNWIRMHIPM